jgi:FkbM family methyltransferase
MITQACLRVVSATCRRFQDFPGRWRLVRWAVRNIRRTGSTMGQTTVLTAHGFRFTCDLADWIGQYVFVTGNYEEPTAALMRHLVNPGDVVVDVGANIGFFTLLLSRLVGPDGRVIAFEPMPHALERLRAHLALNHCDNVTLRECAVGSTSGTARLYLGPRHHSSIASLQPREGAASVDVDSSTLDEALQDVATVKCVKIDAEGWEPEVLAGAGRLLGGEAPPFLIAEVSDPGWPGSLIADGFQAFIIERDGLRRIAEVREDMGQFNALLSRQPLPPHVRLVS